MTQHSIIFCCTLWDTGNSFQTWFHCKLTERKWHKKVLKLSSYPLPFCCTVCRVVTDKVQEFLIIDLKRSLKWPVWDCIKALASGKEGAMIEAILMSSPAKCSNPITPSRQTVLLCHLVLAVSTYWKVSSKLLHRSYPSTIWHCCDLELFYIILPLRSLYEYESKFVWSSRKSTPRPPPQMINSRPLTIVNHVGCSMVVCCVLSTLELLYVGEKLFRG